MKRRLQIPILSEFASPMQGRSIFFPSSLYTYYTTILHNSWLTISIHTIIIKNWMDDISQCLELKDVHNLGAISLAIDAIAHLAAGARRRTAHLRRNMEQLE